MKRLVSALRPATKGLALGSLAVALGYESWLARPIWGLLPQAVAVAALVGLIGGRFAPWPTTAAVLFFTFISPAVALLLLGRFTVEFLLVWSAALTGVMAADRDRWQWAFPSTARFALILWALIVALAWPITALRETDFESLALLQRYNIPNTGIGGSPRTVIIWGMDTAIIHLLGLLWFNTPAPRPPRPGDPRPGPAPTSRHRSSSSASRAATSGAGSSGAPAWRASAHVPSASAVTESSPRPPAGIAAPGRGRQRSVSQDSPSTR